MLIFLLNYSNFGPKGTSPNGPKYYGNDSFREDAYMFQEIKRRQFLKESAAGVSALAAGLSGSMSAGVPMTEARELPEGPSEDRVGRPVRVVSIGFCPRAESSSAPFHSLEWTADLVDREGARGADLIVLPEECRGTYEKNSESLDGPLVTAMSRLAQKYRTYIVCAMRRKEGEQHFNSVVLLNRKGTVACVYNKLYPVWQEECMDNSVQPGSGACVYQADFGRVGFAICFDVNWPSLWEQLRDRGAELVIWPSAYSAGRTLQAHAMSYNYYVVSATWTPDCAVYDLDGDQILHETNNQGDGRNITRIALDLDRCIFHDNLNRPDKLARLLKERGEDIVEEKTLRLEAWFVLKAKRPGVSARKLARQYGLEELTHYINRSRCEIDKCRGWEFS